MHLLKKIPNWLKVTFACLTLILCILFTAYLFINSKLDKIHRVHAESTISPEDEFFDDDTKDLVSTSPTCSTLPSETPSSTPTPTLISANDYIFSNKNIKNILLIGQDRLPEEKRARSDSMILITLNKDSSTIQMTSFMRDLYVEIPGYSNNKLNSAFAFGSTELVTKTFKRNFGITIDDYVIVDFTNFQKIIDILGGIDITISNNEAEYLNNKGFDVSKGNIHMDGALTLAFSRIRKIDSDFCRTSRQRDVLCTLFDNFSNKSYLEIYQFSDKILPYISTTLSNSEILTYLQEIFEKNKIDTHRIPVDNSYNDTFVNNMSVLIPDLNLNKEYLKEWLY